jgi:hypothetical protein
MGGGLAMKRFDAGQYLGSPEDVTSYLEAAFTEAQEQGDPGIFTMALQTASEWQRVNELTDGKGLIWLDEDLVVFLWHLNEGKDPTPLVNETLREIMMGTPFTDRP